MRPGDCGLPRNPQAPSPLPARVGLLCALRVGRGSESRKTALPPPPPPPPPPQKKRGGNTAIWACLDALQLVAMQAVDDEERKLPVIDDDRLRNVGREEPQSFCSDTLQGAKIGVRLPK